MRRVEGRGAAGGMKGDVGEGGGGGSGHKSYTPQIWQCIKLRNSFLVYYRSYFSGSLPLLEPLERDE